MMGEKWIVPAPVWQGETFISGSATFGFVDQYAPNKWSAELADIWRNSRIGMTFTDEPEARAWVEHEVMKALGAVKALSFHPDVLACHAQFGGDLAETQRKYDEAGR